MVCCNIAQNHHKPQIIPFCIIMHSIHRPLARLHQWSDEFTAEQVGATQWAPGERGLHGECVGQPKDGMEKLGQTWSNSWTSGQGEQNTRSQTMTSFYRTKYVKHKTSVVKSIIKNSCTLNKHFASTNSDPDADCGSVDPRVTLDTFLQGCLGKVTVLVGQAGSGKTLLMSTLGQQWAHGLVGLHSFFSCYLKKNNKNLFSQM